mmetsp:Transcript_68559/g.216929  ORF Transcript_68559/g.216929 Transcript_68559/m.216929 type:complete len:160 (+) Transcript_68559:91-570(+)
MAAVERMAEEVAGAAAEAAIRQIRREVKKAMNAAIGLTPAQGLREDYLSPTTFINWDNIEAGAMANLDSNNGTPTVLESPMNDEMCKHLVFFGNKAPHAAMLVTKGGEDASTRPPVPVFTPSKIEKIQTPHKVVMVDKFDDEVSLFISEPVGGDPRLGP